MNDEESQREIDALKEGTEILCGLLQQWIHLARIKDEHLTSEAGLAEFLKKHGEVHRQNGRSEETLADRETVVHLMWNKAWRRALLAEEKLR